MFEVMLFMASPVLMTCIGSRRYKCHVPCMFSLLGLGFRNDQICYDWGVLFSSCSPGLLHVLLFGLSDAAFKSPGWTSFRLCKPRLKMEFETCSRKG